ncbi:MAG TPA: FAD-dependent oxidoreductase, partial [Beijerinckiaceae bacterium]|nr:FAD-dependent oxidoreductase [Beijerinckiaceae bacterium]
MIQEAIKATVWARGRNVPEEDLEILVVGGGIGGLSVALALAHKGRRVRVLEQAPQFGAIGYGI